MIWPLIAPLSVRSTETLPVGDGTVLPPSDAVGLVVVGDGVGTAGAAVAPQPQPRNSATAMNTFFQMTCAILAALSARGLHGL